MKKKENYIFGQRNLKIIGYIVILFSIYLLSVEVQDFMYLPTRHDERFDFISLAKYKEDTLSRFYIWALLFLAGIGFIKRNSLGWIMPQFFLIFGCAFFILLGIFGSLKQNLIVLITAVMLILLTFFLIKFFLREKTRTYFKIEPSSVKMNYLIIIILIGFIPIIDYCSYYIFE